MMLPSWSGVAAKRIEPDAGLLFSTPQLPRRDGHILLASAPVTCWRESP